MDARQNLWDEVPGEEGPIHKPRLSSRMEGEREGDSSGERWGP